MSENRTAQHVWLKILLEQCTVTTAKNYSEFQKSDPML
jgi:hypothetical protein